ncbi:super-infection exclusion protein B [Clostridium disporicum]|uniref:Superinfection exclusion protein B n=1 Tax=Clostridium disporicum TaxID=84024 RepID=A0A174AHD1_9CLOT|nr:super-infection exclusion protein B [Clostridium disporicum]CUN86908.1 Uncharacterised protein [Clostridium disporicum]
MELIKTIVDKFKIKELVGVVFFTTLLITILPKNIIELMYLGEFKEKYQVYISLGLIIASAYYILSIIVFISEMMVSKLINSKKIAIKYMKNQISPDEMQLIIKTFYDDTNKIFKSSGYISYSDGRKAALENKKIIYLASTISRSGSSFAYNLQPYAREFLNKNLKYGNIKINNDLLEYNLS